MDSWCYYDAIFATKRLTYGNIKYGYQSWSTPHNNQRTLLLHILVQILLHRGMRAFISYGGWARPSHGCIILHFNSALSMSPPTIFRPLVSLHLTISPLTPASSPSLHYHLAPSPLVPRGLIILLDLSPPQSVYMQEMTSALSIKM